MIWFCGRMSVGPSVFVMFAHEVLDIEVICVCPVALTADVLSEMFEVEHELGRFALDGVGGAKLGCSARGVFKGDGKCEAAHDAVANADFESAGFEFGFAQVNMVFA